MSLSKSELKEFEELLQKKEIALRKEFLNSPDETANKNYTFLKQSIEEQEFEIDAQGNPRIIKGKRGCALEGSSRSGKTWSGVDVIIWLCLYVETQCEINIYRATYNEFKSTLYSDFKRRLEYYKLPNPFLENQEIKSFKIGKNIIRFLGDGKHGGGCDYAFFNEVMFIGQNVFDNVEMRCRKFWWADYNPSVTDHWFFKTVLPRPDVGYLRTTYLDNKHISFSELSKILGYEPFLPGSYIVKDNDLYCYNKATSKVEIISDKNLPPPHPENVKNGTADFYMHKVYALGLRGAMEGVIIKHIEWIDKFPELPFIYVNDFGFTTDPNATGRFAETEHEIFFEPLWYAPVETANYLDTILGENIGVKKNSVTRNGQEIKGDLIVADSSDKYTGENKGTVKMVSELKAKGYNIRKISKTKNVMYWLTSMKEKKINVVVNKYQQDFKTEKENYVLKSIGGISINQPIDKYNHFMDCIRYGHMFYNSKKPKDDKPKKTLRQLGVNY